MRAPTRFNPIDFYRKAGKPLSVAAREIKHRPVNTAQLSPVGHAFDKLSGPIADYITAEREKKKATAARAEMKDVLSAYYNRGGQRAKDVVLNASMDMDETSDDVERDAGIAFNRPGGIEAVNAMDPSVSPEAQDMRMALMVDSYRQRQAEAVRDENRRYQEGLAEINAQRDIELKGSPGWEKPKKPVPGRDVPYPEEVAEQLTKIAAAEAGSKAEARESAKADNISKMPMPSAIIKIVDDHGSAISTAMGINVDFANITKQLENNKFDPGLFSKIESSARNYFGASTPESRAYGSYKTKLEKIRNDSLRLNKGMQTEGDATRAMNEIIANANDKEFVKLRLKELQVINRRAIELRQYQADSILKQFGRPPLKIPGFKKPAANALPEGITEEDVAETMKANNMTRKQVLERLRNGG